MPIAYLPNTLTFLRIFLVPIIVVFVVQHQYDFALLLFFIAGVTDGLDGYIAKKYNCESRLGGMIDPLADKLLLLSLFIVFAWQGAMPLWFLLAAALRDVLIVSGFLVLKVLHGKVETNPIFFSKLNTCLQILLIIDILAQSAGWYDYAKFTEVLVYITMTSIIISTVQYIYQWAFKPVKQEL